MPNLSEILDDRKSYSIVSDKSKVIYALTSTGVESGRARTARERARIYAGSIHIDALFDTVILRMKCSRSYTGEHTKLGFVSLEGESAIEDRISV